MVLRALAVATLLLFSSCGLHLAAENQQRINRVRIGQTLAEVERTMGRGPERRSTRLRFDGLSIEEWSYVTDYMRHADTMITFVGGKVVEIRVVPWEEKD